MSYSLGLESGSAGLGSVPPAVTRSSGNPMDTGGIVPPSCSALTYWRMPPATIAPTQTLVVAYPYVLGSPSDVEGVLAEILGNEGQGGPALLRWLVSAPDRLSFIGGGWMRDSKSTQSVTKGTLYLALSPRAPTPRGTLERWAEMLLISAIGMRGTAVTRSTSSRLGPRINLLTRWSTVAAGETDDELRAAAYKSAGAGAVFGAFIRVAVQQAPRSSRPAARLSGAFQRLAANVAGAQQIVMNIDALVGGVDGAIASALDMSSDQAAQAIALLDTARGQLMTAQTTVRAGVTAAPEFIANAGEQRNSVLAAVRAAVLAPVESAVQRGSPLELAREFYRCSILTQAKRSLDSALVGVDTALTNGNAAALWLVDNTKNVDSAMKKIQSALGRIEKAMEQIPLGWLMRSRLGLPVWGWLGIGGVAVVGGAFGLRALKKRRKKKLGKNRRRRRASR